MIFTSIFSNLHNNNFIYEKMNALERFVLKLTNEIVKLVLEKNKVLKICDL